MEYVPADSEFVVESKDPAALERLPSLLGGDAQVDPVPGDAHRRVVRFSTPGEARSRAQELQSRLGAELRVYPLLLDPSGRRLLPTGQVRVRFNKKVDDHALEKFAAANALKLVERDEYAPEQATFQAARPRDYLLDVVERATDSADVRLAWPETRAKYTKSD